MSGGLLKLRTSSSLPAALFFQISQPSRRRGTLAAVSPLCHRNNEHQRPGAQLQPARPFSVSCADLGRSKKQRRENKVRRTALPLIPTTNNEMLDEYVAKINHNIFQVDHVPARYRKLVLNPALHGVLQPAEDTPEGVDGHIKLTIDGRSVPLVPILRPERRKKISPVIKDSLYRCEHPRDYDVFPPLIDGLTFSRLPILQRDWERLIRTLGMQGRSGLAIAIAHQGVKERRNNFPGGSRAIIRELYRGLLVRFLLPDGDAPLLENKKNRPKQYEECLRALSRAEVIKGIIKWRPVQPGGKKVVEKKYRKNNDGTFRYDATANGVILYMEAELARRYRGGEDAKGNVLQALSFMRRLWKDAEVEIKQYDQDIKDPPMYSPDKNPEEGPEYDESMRLDYHIARRALVDYDPVLQGLKLAKAIVPNSGDPGGIIDRAGLMTWLNQVIPKLESTVNDWKGLVTIRNLEREQKEKERKEREEQEMKEKEEREKEEGEKKGGSRRDTKVTTEEKKKLSWKELREERLRLMREKRMGTGNLMGLQIYEGAANDLHKLRESASAEDRDGNWWGDLVDIPVNMSGKPVDTEAADETLAKAVLKN